MNYMAAGLLIILIEVANAQTSETRFSTNHGNVLQVTTNTVASDSFVERRYSFCLLGETTTVRVNLAFRKSHNGRIYSTIIPYSAIVDTGITQKHPTFYVLNDTVFDFGLNVYRVRRDAIKRELLVENIQNNFPSHSFSLRGYAIDTSDLSMKWISIFNGSYEDTCHFR